MEDDGGVRSICRWTGNEDFKYGISRFLEKLPVITGKNNEKSGFEIIKNGISIFGPLSKKFIFLFLILVRFLEHFEDF